MFERIELARMAQALASHAGARLGLVSQNIANADTPGFKARDLSGFDQVWRGADRIAATRPGHMEPHSLTQPHLVPTSALSDPNGNTVSLESEMVKAAQIRQDHDMALSVYRATSDILRTSLGRR
ncbi:FlgB family protein [Falsirhodobacter halotolerans]|uniref:FlgB family protein n=1 Tax=Falsirhodobacter halotolerans TaxID=1146892 RepID=UPI001FD1DA89|nr:FlgB family protein [Falsirhodobacter halotolerans]MCJ8140565.1 FlgB family protein [Falsirhodobacter halotolerans]